MEQAASERVDLRLVPAALTGWAVTAAGIGWGVGAALAAVCAAVGGGWTVLRRFAGQRYPVLRAASAAVLGAAAVGAGLGLAVALRSDAVAHHPLRAAVGSTVWVTVIPTEHPRPVAGGRLLFRADLTDDGGRVVVFAPSSGYAELTAGRPARFRARITVPRRPDLTVAALSATGRPVLGDASALQRAAAGVRARFATAAREALPADQAALLPGLVLGDTSTVAPATTADFKTVGLTHLTAVSGANVTIVCGTVLLIAAVVGPRVAVVLAALVLAGFVVVVTPGASVLRAAVMGAISLLAVLAARRRQAIPILAATVLALLLLAPQLAVDAGFALSVSATAALVVLAPLWSARLVGRGWPKPLADAVAIAVAAQLVTAPLIAAISGRLSLVSVVANLLVAVVIPPITVLGTAAAALCPALPGLAGLLIRFTGPELWWLLAVARRAAALPGAAVGVPSGWAGLAVVGAAAVAAATLWRRRWFRLAAAGATVCLVAWSVSGLVVGS